MATPPVVPPDMRGWLERIDPVGQKVIKFAAVILPCIVALLIIGGIREERNNRAEEARSDPNSSANVAARGPKPQIGWRGSATLIDGFVNAQGGYVSAAGKMYEIGDSWAQPVIVTLGSDRGFVKERVTFFIQHGTISGWFGVDDFGNPYEPFPEAQLRLSASR
jgi:hypothetical protein